MTKYTYNEISELRSEEEKNSEEYLIGNIDNIIYRLEYTKKELIKAYNYYAGIRDNKKYSYLVANAGIGNPTDIPFISLIRPRIQVLLGVQLDHPLDYKITATSEYAHLIAEEEKKRKILAEIYNRLNKYAFDQLDQFEHLKHKKESETGEFSSTINYNSPSPSDTLSIDEINKIIEEVNQSFQSSLEESAQYVLDYLIDKHKLKHKLVKMLKHLLIAGECYYRVTIEEIGQDPEIKILNPLNFFYMKDVDVDEIKYCPEAFYRERLTPTEILNRWGHQMTDKEKEQLIESFPTLKSYVDNYWNPELEGRLATDSKVAYSDEIYTNPSNRAYRSPYSQDYYLNVYHVEWLANNEITLEEEIDMMTKDIHSTINFNDNEKKANRKKTVKRYRLDRYEGIRIGGIGGIYINMMKSPNVVRSIDNPYQCTLSFNGGTYSELNSKPYSMVLALEEVQDHYDITHYHRNNIIEHASVGGVVIDLPLLPTFMGDDPMERAEKTLANRRRGVVLTDSSQEGVREGGQYGITDYPSNLDSSLIQSYEAILQRWDDIASEITGVNRQMLGQTMERDGASVTKQALAQASLVTREWFSLLDMITQSMLTDLVNAARISYSEGRKGNLVIGNKVSTFTLNSNFPMSDYRVFVSDSKEEVVGIQEVKQITRELIQAGQIDVRTALKLVTAKSLSEAIENTDAQLRNKDGESLKKLQAENQQLQQQLQQMQQQLQQAESAKMEIEKQKLQLEQMQASAKVEDMKEQRRLKEKDIDLENEARKRRDDIEKIQAVASNLPGSAAEVQDI